MHSLSSSPPPASPSWPSPAPNPPITPSILPSPNINPPMPNPHPKTSIPTPPPQIPSSPPPHPPMDGLPKPLTLTNKKKTKQKTVKESIHTTHSHKTPPSSTYPQNDMSRRKPRPEGGRGRGTDSKSPLPGHSPYSRASANSFPRRSAHIRTSLILFSISKPALDALISLFCKFPNP